ncbi:MAG: GNAT family N-acetyltransferase [Candidatus Latescibacterota bacterium]
MTLREVPAASLAERAWEFQSPHLHLILQSVAAGNTAACAWTLDPGDPARLCVLWELGNKGLWVMGHDTTAEGIAALAAAAAGALPERARALGLRRLAVRGVGPGMHACVEHAFAGRLTGACTVVFHHLPPGSTAPVASPPCGVDLVPVNGRLLAGGQANADAVAAEVRWMWPSLERYLGHGWGVAAVAHGEVVGWCTAEFVGPERCSVCLETVEKRRRQGIGTGAGSRLVALSLARGRTPCWECDAANLPSLRLAARLGFVPCQSEPQLLGTWE